MDPLITSSVIGSAAGLAGGLFSNSASAEQAKKQMTFQRYMSNTAYSRAVKDMKRAGLNPVLAAGSPASTPAGAMGQTVNLGDTLSKGAATAIQYRSAKAQVNQIEQDAARIEVGKRDAELEYKLKKDAIDAAEKNPAVYDMLLKGYQQKLVGTGAAGSMVGQVADAISDYGMSLGKVGNNLLDKIRQGFGKVPTSAKDQNENVRKGYEAMWDLMEKSAYDRLSRKEQINHNADKVMREYRRNK